MPRKTKMALPKMEVFREPVRTVGQGFLCSLDLRARAGPSSMTPQWGRETGACLAEAEGCKLDHGRFASENADLLRGGTNYASHFKGSRP